jgi:hypothetical protein
MQEIVPKSFLQAKAPSESNDQAKSAESSVLFSATYRFIYPVELSSPEYSSAAPPASPQESTLGPTTPRQHTGFLLSDPSDQLLRCTLDSSGKSTIPGDPEYYDIFNHTQSSGNRVSIELDNFANVADDIKTTVPSSPSSSCFPSDVYNYVSLLGFIAFLTLSDL